MGIFSLLCLSTAGLFIGVYLRRVRLDQEYRRMDRTVFDYGNIITHPPIAETKTKTKTKNVKPSSGISTSTTTTTTTATATTSTPGLTQTCSSSSSFPSRAPPPPPPCPPPLPKQQTAPKRNCTKPSTDEERQPLIPKIASYCSPPLPTKKEKSKFRTWFNFGSPKKAMQEPIVEKEEENDMNVDIVKESKNTKVKPKKSKPKIEVIIEDNPSDFRFATTASTSSAASKPMIINPKVVIEDVGSDSEDDVITLKRPESQKSG